MTYPLTYPDNGDPRFTGALLDEIGAVLTAHGYPSVDGDDTAFADLREALRGFLYGSEFNRGDKVTWMAGSKVWCGRVDLVANTESGPVARILTDPQPGHSHRNTVTTVVPCRELTLVSGGSR